MIRFLCPTCGHGLSASSKKAGSVSSCPSCNQMVQVPKADKPAAAPSVRPRRESMGPFWALMRMSLWGLCFFVVVVTVVFYFIEIEKKLEPLEKALLSVQTLVYMLGTYYLARTFEDSTKSLEELIYRLRRKKS